MILLDTSIVIALSRHPGLLSHTLPPLDEVNICGVTIAELLQGIRSETEARFVTGMLSGFRRVPIVELIWSETGYNLRKLRQAGITIPFSDAIIATVAIYFDLEIWSTDRHFSLASHVLPELRIFHSNVF
jgi:predicted nucleic acid-binding protein